MGNTASDRVAGERHGAKAARVEGAGGPGPSKEHKIMVGSTDDPSVFSLPDAKVSEPPAPAGGDPAAAWAPLVQVTVLVNSGDFPGAEMLDGNSACSAASKQK